MRLRNEVFRLIPHPLTSSLNLGFAPRSRRTRSWWRGTSGRPSPWSCPTERTQRNLARFLAIRARQTAVSASVSARWRRFGGRSAGRRGVARHGGLAVRTSRTGRLSRTRGQQAYNSKVCAQRRDVGAVGARSGLGGSLGGWGAERAHRATARAFWRSGDELPDLQRQVLRVDLVKYAL